MLYVKYIKAVGRASNGRRKCGNIEQWSSICNEETVGVCYYLDIHIMKKMDINTVVIYWEITSCQLQVQRRFQKEKTIVI